MCGFIVELPRRLLNEFPSLHHGDSQFTGQAIVKATPGVQAVNVQVRREEFQILASATIVLLLVILLAMNAVAILIRNRTQKRW